MTGPFNPVQPGAETIFITGYAKLPSSITAEKLYQVIAVGVEIDPNTGIIVECDVTLATIVGRSFFKKLVLGYNLSEGIDGLILQFEKRYHGSARKAIITGLKIMYEKWLAYLQSRDTLRVVSE